MADRSGDAGVACDGWDYSGCEGTKYCPPRCPRFVDGDGTALLVRPYESDHRDALVQMYEEIDADSRTLGLPPESREGIEDWLDHLTSNGWNLVALAGDDVIGHIAAAPLDDEEPHIVVFVHHAYQNRGLGIELIRQLIAHADDRDHGALVLTVAAENERARTVYDNIGFDVSDRLATEITMRLAIEEPIAKRVRLPPVERP